MQPLPRNLSRFLCGEDWPLSRWTGIATEQPRHLVLHYTGEHMFERGRINSYDDRYPREVGHTHLRRKLTLLAADRCTPARQEGRMDSNCLQ